MKAQRTNIVLSEAPNHGNKQQKMLPMFSLAYHNLI